MSRWTEVRRIFTPPNDDDFTGSQETVQRAAFGFTTIEISNGRRSRFDVVLGDQRLAPDPPPRREGIEGKPE